MVKTEARAGRIPLSIKLIRVWRSFFRAMNYVEKLLDGVHSVLNINAATFSGSIDVIAVEQQDGTHPSVSSCFDQGRGI